MEIIARIFIRPGIHLLFCQFHIIGPKTVCEINFWCNRFDDFENAHADKIIKQVVGNSGKNIPVMPNTKEQLPNNK